MDFISFMYMLNHFTSCFSGLILSSYICIVTYVGLQIVQLTASGEFEEALALCKLLPPEDSNLRAAKESSIHIRYVSSCPI